MTNEQREAYIKGLLVEKANYERTGDTDNVAHVAAELKRVGHEATPPARRAQTRKAR